MDNLVKVAKIERLKNSLIRLSMSDAKYQISSALFLCFVYSIIVFILSLLSPLLFK